MLTIGYGGRQRAYTLIKKLLEATGNLREWLKLLLAVELTLEQVSMKQSRWQSVGILCLLTVAQAQTAPDRAPLPLLSPVQDKNFYLFSTIERGGEAEKAVENDATLSQLTAAKRDALNSAAKTCREAANCYAEAMKWSAADTDRAAEALRSLYRSSEATRKMVDGPLRRSGVFIRYGSRSGDDLLAQAWRDAAQNTNRIIDVYALGASPRYPQVDSISYDATSKAYGQLVSLIAAVLDDERADLVLFFQPSLKFALALLDVNRRDEAGRFEPLEEGENRAAIHRARTIDWAKYPYSVIVVPGAGPETAGVALSPRGKLRLTLAVRRYRQGMAPFLLVSGGFVHPNQTPYSEAIEMKKSLIADFAIPADAILVDPQARHTTTNLRNAVRQLYRYGFPLDKRGLITTDSDHSASIEADAFRQRCITEIGYMPIRELRRVSLFDLSFLSNVESLQFDSEDPLDP